jgi:hypothetical protein
VNMFDDRRDLMKEFVVNNEGIFLHSLSVYSSLTMSPYQGHALDERTTEHDFAFNHRPPPAGSLTAGWNHNAL